MNTIIETFTRLNQLQSSFSTGRILMPRLEHAVLDRSARFPTWMLDVCEHIEKWYDILIGETDQPAIPAAPNARTTFLLRQKPTTICLHNTDSPLVLRLISLEKSNAPSIGTLSSSQNINHPYYDQRWIHFLPGADQSLRQADFLTIWHQSRNPSPRP